MAQLVLVGLDWQLALLFTAFAVAIFLVMSRVVAETGAFFIHAWWFPSTLIWGVFGAQALGPKTLLIMMLVCSLLLIDPREALMPFVVHAFKLVDLQRVKVQRTAIAGMAALCIAFAVAIPATLYWQYSRGVFQVSDGWSDATVPTMALFQASLVQRQLKAVELLESSESLHGWARLLHLQPDKTCLFALAVTFALTLGCCLGRLRFSKWPLHPVLFIVLGTYQCKLMAVSFLIGWLIKLLVNRFGGAIVYQQYKPFMIGLIAGEMLGGVIPMIIGLIYYLCTHTQPPPFSVLAG